ncbi:predicted protein [Sclerotinia sclerotiorum 1980 UF-70]|uniref:Uncharacterized protein n=1 Tax=Sclerotinia sclerotiorum (strain ATCC 18683 / 1980 / Ss-1) TaxID=665079 RepID=A7EUV1_SCLS1|nr:predicted protein [Sclerotinia sclerotiorum 1980 UF-70]EDN93243.1 predicted protein [Sclerotinia sclerotiorum 1980 UF-70]
MTVIAPILAENGESKVSSVEVPKDFLIAEVVVAFPGENSDNVEDERALHSPH